MRWVLKFAAKKSNQIRTLDATTRWLVPLRICSAESKQSKRSLLYNRLALTVMRIYGLLHNRRIRAPLGRGSRSYVYFLSILLSYEDGIDRLNPCDEHMHAHEKLGLQQIIAHSNSYPQRSVPINLRTSLEIFEGSTNQVSCACSPSQNDI